MKRSLLRTSISALALLVATSVPVLAEQIEGQVSGVSEGGSIEITLPAGAIVSPGDLVQILAEIPGLGLSAITTQWEVESLIGGTVTARPLGALTGMPQAGYTARIETANAAVPVEQPNPAISADPEADALYQRGAEMMKSNDFGEQAEGVGLLNQAAWKKHPRATTDLAAALMFGRGNDPDVEGAMNLHATAAELGDTLAMIRLGLAHASGAQGPYDKAQAFNWMKMAADNGDPEGMFLTAMIYEDGAEGVPASMPEMVKWLTKAAQNGHAFAMFILGHIYLDGEDGIIPKDSVKTERYWTMAAEKGLVEAMEMLAEFYEGEDTAASAHWAAAAKTAPRRAPWREDPRCLSVWECYIPQIMESAAPPLSTEDSARLPFEMQPCDRLAATNNDPDLPDASWGISYGDVDGPRAIEACLADIKRFPESRRFHTQLATAYHRVERYHEAFVEASTAAEMGSTQAMGMVAIMYKNGRGVEKNPTNALYWFEKAAGLGNITAMHFAGYMQLNGDGVPFNTKAAVKWFQTAADLGTGFGSAEAMAQLGLLYDNGQGVAYNPDKSAANLMSGLALGSAKAQDILLKNHKQLSTHTLTEVQRLLQQEGLYQGALDGKFGPQTFQALRSKIQK